VVTRGLKAPGTVYALRIRGGLSCLVVALALVPGPGTSGGARGPAPSFPGSECTATADGRTPRAIEDAVAEAEPGDVVCVRPGVYDSGAVELRRSGKSDAPIEVRALGRVVLENVRIDAKHVSFIGFEITSPPDRAGDGLTPGISLRGTGLVVSDNFVHDTAGDGIACVQRSPSCVDAVISRNTVRGADGTGIVVSGRSNRVARNEVSESVRIRASDADGIRFFGTGHVIRSNRVHDISDDGYPGDAPHTDCFQTFDNGKPPTSDVLIDGNICDNVAHQCLIATAEQSGELGVIGRSHSLRFTNNICRNLGAQGVLVEQFPDVVVAFNAFADTIGFRAASFLSGSSQGAFLNNIVDGSYPAYELDDSSAPGWVAEGNLRALGSPGVPPSETGVETVDLLFAAPSDAPVEVRYAPGPLSRVIDAGVEVSGVERDLAGTRRPLDGLGTGTALPDVGPYEYRRDL
jgi:hypothetical protein